MQRRTLTGITLALATALAVASCSSDSTSKATETSKSDSTSTSSTTKKDTSSSSEAAAEAAPKPSTGCDAAKPAADIKDEKHTMTVGDLDREYLLTYPAAATTPAPLVVDIHGLLEGDTVHTQMSKFSDLALREKFAVITPNGTGDPVHWESGDAVVGAADLAYFDAVIAEVDNTYCMDTSRRYATGLSNGAMMTWLLACHRTDMFAAVAPIAGVLPPKDCSSKAPMPILAIHGTADPIVKFNGGYGNIGKLVGTDTSSTSGDETSPSADLNGEGHPASLAAWAKRNGCKTTPTDTDLPDADGDTTTSVIRRVYDCPTDAATEFYIVVGGGHSWPGSDFSKVIANVVGPTTFDFNATAVAWELFNVCDH